MSPGIPVWRFTLLAPAAFALFASVPALGKPAPSLLDQAITDYDGFNDAGATVLLRRFLAAKPRPPEAAKAHLYLGLIALNAVDSVAAREEFDRAITLDPTIELAYGAPPKAVVLFGQARQDVSRAATKPVESPSVAAVTTAPASPASSTVPAAALEAPSAGPVRWPGFALGGVAIAAVGVGAIFGGLYQSDWSSANSPTTPAYTAQSQQLQSQTNAQVADGLFIAAAAVGIVAVILVITEWPSSRKSAETQSATGVF
jgi:hypothetical protein